jgi:hypothetical protein
MRGRYLLTAVAGFAVGFSLCGFIAGWPWEPSRRISWDWTAIGTVGLALVTSVGLVISEMRLREERARSDRAMQKEREEAADVRRRDRQRVDAIELIRHLTILQPLLTGVPALALRERRGSSPFPGAHSFTGPEDLEARAAVELLRRGGWTEAALLGPDGAAREAADRYRQLVRLVDEATLSQPGDKRDLVIDALSNYSTWVRMSLQGLAENETVPTIGDGARKFPDLGQEPGEAWKPNPEPPDWAAETKLNRPIRRSMKQEVHTRSRPPSDDSAPA